MPRASQGLKAKRLNHARDLLQRFQHLPDAVSRMVQDSSLSPRQAYRYLQQEAAGKTDPCERRKEMLRGEQVRLRNQMERLITAYQDGLLTLEQLRERMPHLKQQSQAVNSELQLLEMAKLDQAKYLKLAESLGGFRNKLRAHAQTPDVKERQQILRLLVKEILVGFDTLTIRHSIPIPFDDGPPPNVPGSAPIRRPDYPLRPRRVHAGLGQTHQELHTPVLAKHTKSFNLVDTLSVGVDRIQRNFEPMQRQVESWRQTQIADAKAKLIFYSAFVDGKLDAPKSLLPEVHRLYFEPEYQEFSPRTMWSLSDAFTSAFKKLDPVLRFKATAKLGAFLDQLPN